MKKFVIYSLIIVIAASCSNYARVVKKGTTDEKYDMAVAMYRKRDYVRALPLFEELLAFYRGKEQSEGIYRLYAYCYYGLGQFDLASYHFKNFTENYYNSRYMEECSFMYVHCLYKDAGDYFLDQTSTIKAIGEIQLFLNVFPGSGAFEVDSSRYVDDKNGFKVRRRDTLTYKEQANIEIEELRVKIKTKAFENAMLFYRIEDYNAAVVSFKNTIKDFPDMENKDFIELMIVKSSYYYAKYSVDDKKEERYKAVFTEYKEFARNNKPGSRYASEAAQFNAKAEADLIKHQKLNKIQ